MQIKSVFSGLKQAMVVAAALVFMLAIYAPFQIYSSNSKEFWFDIVDMLPSLAVLFSGMFILNAVLLVILYLIKPGLGKLAGVAEAILLIGLFLQGNFLAGRIPIMDGTDVDWSAFRGNNVLTIIVFAVLIIVSGFFVFRIKDGRKKLYEAAGYIGALFLAYFIVLILLGLITNSKEIFKDSTFRQVTYDKVMDYSDERNVIVFLMDQVDGEKLYDIIKSDKEYEDVFEDFTFFDNAMSGYGHTKYSVPLILTGQWYENDRSFSDYFQEALDISPLFKSLDKDGYRVGLYYDELKNYKTTPEMENVSEGVIKVSDNTGFARTWCKLVLYRYLPYAFKPAFYFDIDEFNAFKEESSSSVDLYDWSNFVFYDHVKNTPVTKSEPRAFKYIHVRGAHSHYTIDENINEVEAVPYEEGGYVMAMKGCIALTREYLKRLKDGGVYDNSAIVVMSDHGYDKVYMSENPALFIKGVGEKHDLKVNGAPVSYVDMQECLIRLSHGLQSDEVFDYKEGDDRTRRFLHYDESDKYHFYEYEMTGRVLDMEKTLPTGREFIKE